MFLTLPYHWHDRLGNIYLRNEEKRQRPGQMISIKEACSFMPAIIHRYILFIDAWSGCDATSATFGHGILHLMNILGKFPKVQNLSNKSAKETLVQRK